MANTKKFNIKDEAVKLPYAAVGVVDLVVERARGYAADVQTRVEKIDLEPAALRDQARTVVTTRVDELQRDVEKRVADLQEDAKAFPGEFEKRLNETVTDGRELLDSLAARGEKLVERIRRQQATQDAKAAAKTTKAKAKTTRTQTTKAASSSARSTTTAAKATATKAATGAKKTASTAKSSTKATTTAAKKTATASAKATKDAAAKTGA